MQSWVWVLLGLFPIKKPFLEPVTFFKIAQTENKGSFPPQEHVQEPMTFFKNQKNKTENRPYGFFSGTQGPEV